MVINAAVNAIIGATDCPIIRSRLPVALAVELSQKQDTGDSPHAFSNRLASKLKVS